MSFAVGFLLLHIMRLRHRGFVRIGFVKKKKLKKNPMKYDVNNFASETTTMFR